MKEIPHGYAHLLGLPSVDKLKKYPEKFRGQGEELQFGVWPGLTPERRKEGYVISRPRFPWNNFSIEMCVCELKSLSHV